MPSAIDIVSAVVVSPPHTANRPLRIGAIIVPVPAGPPVYGAFPSSDTIRGGALITIGLSSDLTSTARDATFTGTGLPTGWTSQFTGTGALAFTSTGLRLGAGAAAGSAQVSAGDSYLLFDAAVDIVPQLPISMPGTPIDLGVLELTDTAAGSTARVRLRRGVGTDPSLLVAYGDATYGGATIVGGIAAAPTGSVLTLRLVRYYQRVVGYVGVRDASGLYTSLVRVLDLTDFTSGAGIVRFRTANLAYTGIVRSVFSNFTVRSHVLIDNVLIENKTDYGTRRILGNVPATTLARRGLRDIVVFGLFGEVTGTSAFEYTLPPPKTLGRGSAVLTTYNDPQLRDGRS